KTHASIGISVYPKDGEAPEVLLRKADMALYQAKAIGGDTYTFFEEPAKGESSDKAA
ncbi:MAG: diguanylate cyclase, partial [Actinomycetia bacterium]|nr:diguanylate cyclase [Actinomycetes bacterium]